VHHLQLLMTRPAKVAPHQRKPRFVSTQAATANFPTALHCDSSGTRRMAQPNYSVLEDQIRIVLERGEGWPRDNSESLSDVSREFYRLARRRTIYGRLSDNAGRLLSSLLPEPAKTNPPRPPTPPFDRILDISRLLRQAMTASDQSHSPFFTRLPLELRSKIYSYVLNPSKRIWLRPSPHQITKSGRGGSLWIEHFPSQWTPKDLARINAGCCAAARTGFFGQVNASDLQPDSDTLALIKTCQKIYLDLCGLCTFCFDDVKTLREITALYAALPIRHVQMVFYHCLHSNWYTWDEDQDPREVDAVCKQLPELQTLLLSIHLEPVNLRMAAQDAICAADWLKAITAAPTVYVEVLGNGNAPARVDTQESAKVPHSKS